MVIAILAEEAFRKKNAGLSASPAEEKKPLQDVMGDRRRTRSKKKELLSPPAEIVWADSLRSLTIIDADVYIDLLFDADRERISRLRSLAPKPVLVHAASPAARGKTDHPFIPIVEIRGLRKGNRVTVAAGDPGQEETIARVFDALGWDYRLIGKQTTAKKKPGGGTYLLPPAKKRQQPKKRDEQ
ncbi:MAG TPA: hypothetical protein PK339_05950 [Flavitalea sp.]|nr:hypothetical protein [Flavitalea sp.]